MKTSREQLLTQISQLFFEKGYEKTSIRDISSVSGISHAALYYHFKNKEEMLFAIIDNLIERALVHMRAELDTVRNPEDKIAWIIGVHINFYVEHRAQTKVLLHERGSLAGEYARIISEKETEYVNFMREILQEIIENFGVDIDVNVATFCLMGMLNWIIHWYDPEGRVSPAKLAQNMSTIFLNGLKGKPQPSPESKPWNPDP
jgi:TetR/AcrR family transcriptional regulator, cholesterol catabolism regulator